MIPPEATRLDRIDAETFSVVLGGARTIRGVAAALGLISPSSGHNRVKRATANGLIDWETGKAATIHSLYQVVWLPPNPEAD